VHVHTTTSLSAETIKTRFEKTGSADSEPAVSLIYSGQRRPPKFFLPRIPVAPAAAAEVTITEKSGGADVVLRLMWGPLPAPFPRALAGIGLLLGLLTLILSERTLGSFLLATFFIVIPFAALLYQQQGERVLQSLLSHMLDGATFTPKSH
jgi:hypothetical protein